MRRLPLLPPVRSRTIDKTGPHSSVFVVIAAVFAGNGFQAGAYTVLLADLVASLAVALVGRR